MNSMKYSTVHKTEYSTVYRIVYSKGTVQCTIQCTVQFTVQIIVQCTFSVQNSKQSRVRLVHPLVSSPTFNHQVLARAATRATGNHRETGARELQCSALH